jgi:hypothetical protein
MSNQQKLDKEENNPVLVFIGLNVLLVIPCFLVSYPVVSVLGLTKTHTVYKDNTEAVYKCTYEADCKEAVDNIFTPPEKKTDVSNVWLSAWFLSAVASGILTYKIEKEIEKEKKKAELDS